MEIKDSFVHSKLVKSLKPPITHTLTSSENWTDICMAGQKP